MAKFEVFIPAAGAGTFDLTFRVEADNWLAALNTGLKKIGEKGGTGSNFLVDIQDDNSIHVTDPKSHRVFRITEIEAPQEPTAPMSMASVAAAAPEPNPFDPLPGRSTQLDLPAVHAHAPAPKTGATEAATLPPQPAMEFVPPGATTNSSARPTTEPELQPAFSAKATLPGIPPQAILEQARNDAKNAPAMAQTMPSPQPAVQPKKVPTIPPPGFNPARPPSGARPKSGFTRRPSGIAKNVTEVPQKEVKPPTGRIGRDKPEKVENVDDVLAELFERVQELEEFTSPEEALEFILDLAMEKIAAEAGSIFLADLSTNDLTLGAARGPKSKELLRLNPRVPMGVGIVGFCALEGISIAISDAQRDPRFYRAISDRIGYPTQSILCVPMIRAGRSFGCLEVLNKKSSSRFTEGEIAILGYLGDATARYLESMG